MGHRQSSAVEILALAGGTSIIGEWTSGGQGTGGPGAASGKQWRFCLGQRRFTLIDSRDGRIVHALPLGDCPLPGGRRTGLETRWRRLDEDRWEVGYAGQFAHQNGAVEFRMTVVFDVARLEARYTYESEVVIADGPL